MDPVDACFHFAGIVGLDGQSQSLKNYWRLACGRIKQRRSEMVELATLVWAFSDIDVEQYIHYGSMESLNINGPVELPDDLEAKVQAEVERLRAADPHLPKAKF